MWDPNRQQEAKARPRKVAGSKSTPRVVIDVPVGSSIVIDGEALEVCVLMIRNDTARLGLKASINLPVIPVETLTIRDTGIEHMDKQVSSQRGG